MFTLRPARRVIGVVASGTLVAGLALGVTAVAPVADAASPAVQKITSVTLFFTAPNPAGLARLAAAHGLTHTQRVTALATLVPSASTRAAAIRTLTGDGLTIGYQTAWSVSASGPAATIAGVFGTHPVLPASPTPAQYLAAKGALPLLPSSLRSTVSAAFPTTAGPAVLHNTAATSSLDGTDFRNADTPAGVTPSGGTKDEKSTIATVQFADFYSAGGTGGAAASKTAADLTAYAKEHSLTDPVASGQYKAVTVAGGPSMTDDTMGGDVEVDLDQESILSTAPSANQHAYFAPNTDAGFGDVFAAVFDDVTGDKMATAPDPDITALSSSWGECESATGAMSIDSTEPILESLVAAGVTTFSASGDDGIYDCRSTTGLGVDNSTADVDYPASSPYVVGVGATNLSDANGTQPNTGSNWTETSWTCTSTTTCESSIPLVGTGGTGGGASGSAYDSSTADSFAGFPAPAYQKVGIDDAPFAGATKRLVPDIAADGDPDTGFTLYTSNPMYVAEGGGSNDVQVGGTSLATPISAAQLTNALGDAGVHTGVGGIHGALYSAYQDTKSLAVTDAKKPYRDVTVGTNGMASQMGTDPSVSAQAGYDTNTGLGGVLWSALTPYLTNTATPVTTAKLTLPNIHTTFAPLTAAGTWSAARGKDTSLIDSTTATVIRSGATTPVYSTTSTASSGTFKLTTLPGSTYTLTVTTTDISGRSSTSTSTLVVPIDDTLFTFQDGWSRAAATGDIYGSHANTRTKGLAATVSGYGVAFSIHVPVGPKHGELGVYLAGKRIKTIDEYAAVGGEKLVPIYSSATRVSKTFTFRALGVKNSASASTGISVDAMNSYYTAP